MEKLTKVLLIGLVFLVVPPALWIANPPPAKGFGLSTFASEDRQTAESNETGALVAKKERAGQMLIDDGFEVAATYSFYWNKGESIGGKAGRGGFQRVYIDPTGGAENSKKSLVMEFRFGRQRTPEHQDEKIKARIKYRINKDLSNFNGIRFFIKSDRAMNLMFLLVEKDIRSIYWNRWVYDLTVTKQWKSVVIPFNELKNVNEKAGSRDNRRMLELKNTDSIEWLVTERMLPRGAQAKLWLDQIRLY